MISKEIYANNREGAFKKIKHLRNSYSPRDEETDPTLKKAFAAELFNMKDDDASEYLFVMDEVSRITEELIAKTLVDLIRKHHVEVTPVSFRKATVPNAPLLAFVISKEGRNVLYLVKKFGINHCLSNDILEITQKKYNADEYRYISVVRDYAYAEVLNRNDDENDPGRGTGVYSLRYFFETLLPEEEFSGFEEFEKSFVLDVKKYLGFSIMKSLTPYALFNFKSRVKYSLIHHDYQKDYQESGINISSDQWKLIGKQFVEEKAYKALLGKSDFAQSFVTAEWMYESLTNSQNIDLTAIALGYFKAVEQLLFSFISIHFDEGRTIKKNNGNGYADLTKLNYEANTIDTTLGALIGFVAYIHNRDLFRYDIDSTTQGAIITALRNIKTIRNGYLHKDNLLDWEYVKSARATAYFVGMLIIGSFELSDVEKAALGIPMSDYSRDYYSLCEYMNYNSSKVFFFDYNDGKKICVVSNPDDDMTIDEFGEACYSGAYYRCFITINEDGTSIPSNDIFKVEKISEENVPFRIYTGGMIPCATGIRFEGPKELVFDNGRFIIDNSDEKPGF